MATVWSVAAGGCYIQLQEPPVQTVQLAVQAFPYTAALPAGNTWQCPETVPVPHWKVLLAPHGQRPGKLLNFLQCTGKAPTKKIIRAKVSTALRLRNLVSHNENGSHIAFLQHVQIETPRLLRTGHAESASPASPAAGRVRRIWPVALPPGQGS